MDDQDPISQFFPGQEDVDLYAVLSLSDDATIGAIKKSYRRLALIYHPDKHATATESARAVASTKFQQVGFAYAVLSDERRRQRYDKTGKTDEGPGLSPGEDGWEAYFEDLFDRVTRGKLDDMKKVYQGSAEEVADLKSAYLDTKGSLGEIMTFIPHSTHEDESRFIVIISDLISKKELPSMRTWESSIKDEKAQLLRKKQGEKEAKEAEKLAKELGVWGEFYGSGKVGERKGKGGKGKGKAKEKDEQEEDTSALQALILKKRQKSMDVFFDGLAAKYAEPEPKSKGKGKKRGRAGDDDGDDAPKKKSKRAAPPPPPDIDGAEFEKLQQQLFGDKATGGSSGEEVKKSKGKKTKSK
ncbi:DnaJ-domain-containing protein [Guyanagaster necrorhizus]|uniref:DnaJ-domain-containing protein n=1 Tax=Guyanagaster necrorhizus TaxID=856835 RepID=A0A9P7W4P3_9AGAR|nr:DnaJ-domain-containing protein [Guyanagaster necrorhizus MCA 3950]KAG7452529.1 DnaJ-domain-containing protein [Guyanagaster necrorhizus MCA 3950]